MEESQEKRRTERCRLLTDIYYTFFNSDRFYGCKMLNQRNAGICFQTGLPIRPGTEIMVYLEECRPGELTEKRAEGIRANVRWCSSLPDLDAFFYRVGVAYV